MIGHHVPGQAHNPTRSAAATLDASLSPMDIPRAYRILPALTWVIGRCYAALVDPSGELRRLAIYAATMSGGFDWGSSALTNEAATSIEHESANGQASAGASERIPNVVWLVVISPCLYPVALVLFRPVRAALDYDTGFSGLLLSATIVAGSVLYAFGRARRIAIPHLLLQPFVVAAGVWLAWFGTQEAPPGVDVDTWDLVTTTRIVFWIAALEIFSLALVSRWPENGPRRAGRVISLFVVAAACFWVVPMAAGGITTCDQGLPERLALPVPGSVHSVDRGSDRTSHADGYLSFVVGGPDIEQTLVTHFRSRGWNLYPTSGNPANTPQWSANAGDYWLTITGPGGGGDGVRVRMQRNYGGFCIR